MSRFTIPEDTLAFVIVYEDVELVVLAKSKEEVATSLGFVHFQEEGRDEGYYIPASQFEPLTKEAEPGVWEGWGKPKEGEYYFYVKGELCLVVENVVIRYNRDVFVDINQVPFMVI